MTFVRTQQLHPDGQAVAQTAGRKTPGRHNGRGTTLDFDSISIHVQQVLVHLKLQRVKRLRKHVRTLVYVHSYDIHKNVYLLCVCVYMYKNVHK